MWIAVTAREIGDARPLHPSRAGSSRWQAPAGAGPVDGTVHPPAPACERWWYGTRRRCLGAGAWWAGHA